MGARYSQSTRLLILVSLALCCRPSGQSSQTETSHLRLVETSTLAETLTPCFTLTGLTAAIDVERSGLDELTGTVRRSDDAPLGEVPLTTYLLEFTVDFVDSNGNVLWQEVETTQLNAAATSPVQASLVAAWDGVQKNPDAFTLAPQGDLTMKGEVHLVRVEALDRRIVSEQLLQTVSFEDKAEVVSPTARCLEWERMGHTLGSGQDGTVRVHGQDSPLMPTITWRHGRPRTLLGEMGASSAPTAAARAQAVRGFLDAYPTLYGITGASVTSTLVQVSDNADPDDTHRVVLRQAIDEQRNVGGTMQTVSVRTASGKVNAVFDVNEQLVYLSGRVLEDLPTSFPSAAVDETQAMSVVQQDLTAKSLDTGRHTRLLEQVIYGRDASQYQRAYVIRVGRGDAAAFPAESPEDRSRTFDYTVSAADGAILDIRNRTVLNSIMVTGRVHKYDPSDPGPASGDLASDGPPNIDPNCTIGAPHAQPARMTSPQQVQIRIQDRDDASDPFYLREDEAAVNGVVEEVILEPQGDEFNLPTTAAFGAPRPTPSEDRQALRAMTAYWQMQWFWAVVGQPLIEEDWTRIEVYIDDPDRTACAPGGYQDNEIRLDKGYPNTILYTPAHEIFHHFDELTADVRTDDDLVDPLSMPAILKEGVADFFMQFMTFNPDNSAASGVRTFICIFSSDFNDCMEGGGGSFRSPRLIPYPRHRPLRVADGDTDLSPWPDCRVATNRNAHCMLIRVPGSSDPGTFSWNTSGVSPLGQRALIPQILQDAWETGSTVEGGGHFAAAWPITVAKAFAMLDEEPSFTDFRNAVVFSTLLRANRGAWSSATLAVVNDAFQRHGLDGTLDQFCSDENTEEMCH